MRSLTWHVADGTAIAREVQSEDAPDWLPTRTHRLLLVVASIGLFGPALIAWSSIIQLSAVGVISTCAFAATIALVLLAVTAGTERALRRLDWAVLLLALVLLGAWAATELYFYPAYGTDEAAFVQSAAQLTLHGHNPYTHNLLPALTEFRVPIQYATYKLDGTIASSLAYPSFSFLLVIPFTLITHGVQAVIVANIFFLAIEMILLFLFLPIQYRALSPLVVLGFPFLFDYTLGGDIVTLAMPFMLVVAYRWSDIGREGRLGGGGSLRAVSLGLAASICQFPWFVAPFVILGLLRLRASELGARRGISVVGRFLLITLGTALFVNSPFIAMDPAAWLTGVFSPLFQHAIPFGQGLIDATAFFHIGGGNLSYYTDAALACLVALLAAYGVYFQRVWKVGFVLPSAVFLFSTRSLSEYLIMMVAMWLVSIAAAGDGPIPQRRREGFLRARDDIGRTAPTRHRLAPALVGVPAVACVAFIALALTARPPLGITIESVRTNGQFRSIWQIRALVVNRSHRDVEPHFATDASGYMTTFWNPVAGPRTLGSGERAIYTLNAPNVGSMPGVTQPFVLQAVTRSPETISSSALLTPEPFDCYISPSYVDETLPLGASVDLSVELRSPYGAPAHQAGVRVALGQIIYGQNTLIAGEAQINNAPEGQSPVVAVTDTSGVAKFRIRNFSVQGGNPIYVQAYVDPRNGFPYGYSEVVSVQWAPKSLATRSG